MRAKNEFAELGFSNTPMQPPQPDKSKQKDMTTYPDALLDRIKFPKPLKCTFTQPIEQWDKDDRNFHDQY